MTGLAGRAASICPLVAVKGDSLLDLFWGGGDGFYLLWNVAPLLAKRAWRAVFWDTRVPFAPCCAVDMRDFPNKASLAVDFILACF